MVHWGGGGEECTCEALSRDHQTGGRQSQEGPEGEDEAVQAQSVHTQCRDTFRRPTQHTGRMQIACCCANKTE